MNTFIQLIFPLVALANGNLTVTPDVATLESLAGSVALIEQGETSNEINILTDQGLETHSVQGAVESMATFLH